MRLLFCATLALLVAISYGQACPEVDDMKDNGEINEGVSCFLNPCDPDSDVANDTQEGCPLHCEFKNGACHQKLVKPSVLEEKYGEASEDDLDARNYQIGGSPSLYRYPPGQYPPFVPYGQCPKFPQTCRINPRDPQIIKLLDPPLDVPYCHRIPCNKEDPSLERDALRCQNTPGCYFDRDLGTIRRAAGHSILPGVPVCHLAIRNKAFHSLVQKYKQESNAKWYGMYTKCLIKQNADKIYAQPPGCYMVDVLHYIGQRPKRAGWKGINDQECSLIGGCYKPGKCYYPAELHKIKVRSGVDSQRKPTPSSRDIYGQAMCLPFNIHGSAEEILSSYHHCLQSGCVLDSFVDEKKMRDALYNVTLTKVPRELRHAFWAKVCSGEARPYNWHKILQGLRRPVFPGIQLPVYPPPAPGPYPFSLEVNATTEPPSAQVREVHSFFGGNPYDPQNWCEGDPSQSYLGYTPWGQGGFPPNNQNYPPVNPGPQPYSYQQPPQNLPQYPPQYPPPNPPQYPPQYPPQNRPQYPPQYPPIYPPRPRPRPCPYAFRNTGYFRLKGSFKGCCEKNYCYIPRPELYHPYSGVAPYQSYWSRWSKCSKTCNTGYRTRTRPCIAYRGDRCNPLSEKEQREICNPQPCPYYDNWSDWTDCTVTCGGGTQSRSRVCQPSNVGCGGLSEETRPCRTGKCPRYSWGPWEACSVNCGRGKKRRVYRCDHPGDYQAECDADTYKEADCTVFATPVLSHKSPCYGGYCTKYYKCPSKCPNGRPAVCLSFEREVGDSYCC